MTAPDRVPSPLRLLPVLAGLGVLLAAIFVSEPPAAFGWLTAAAMLAAFGLAGTRLARRLLPDAGRASGASAAFTAGSALALVPATWMGHCGVLRPGVFLLWTAIVLTAAVWLPSGQSPASPGRPNDPRAAASRLERALLWAAAAAIALVALRYLWMVRFEPPGRGPDETSYHLTAVAVWRRFADLRMVKFAMGDPGTTFYPVLGELASWSLLAPFGSSDVLARWSQLPFALASFAALAGILRRLGVSRSATALGVLFYAGIRHAFPELAFSAGNDHSASFYTLAAVDAALALGERPRRGPALYLGAALGLLLGTKYIGILFAPVVAGVAGIALLAGRSAAPGEPDRAGVAPRVGSIAAAAALLGWIVAAAALTGGYTYLRNAVAAGNPLYPLPISLFGHALFPGLPGTSVWDRRGAPEFAIDVWRFLTRRPDAFGNLFPFTLLPAALAAPVLAIARRRFTAAAVLALPLVFFAEFLWLMHDHRDMRYFLPGVALAAGALAWSVDGEGRLRRTLRGLLLATLLVDRVGSLHGPARAIAVAAACAIVALGLAHGRLGGALRALRERVARPAWIATAATLTLGALLLAAALPLGAWVERYQARKLADRPSALALDRLTAASGATIAYAGYNTPYPYFGSRLQNTVRIVPRNGRTELEYFAWGGSPEFPYIETTYRRWRRNLAESGAQFLVIVRSDVEKPERAWVLRHPDEFTLEHGDPEAEVWRIRAR